jgi:hypothetical protein
MKVILKENMSKGKFLIIMCFYIIVSALLIAYPLKLPFELYILKSISITEATIIASSGVYDNYGYDSGGYIWELEYKYNIKNDEYLGKDYISPWRYSLFGANVGDKVKIYYYNNDNNISGVYHVSYVFIAIGIILIIGMVSVYRERKKYK